MRKAVFKSLVTSMVTEVTPREHVGIMIPMQARDLKAGSNGSVRFATILVVRRTIAIKISIMQTIIMILTILTMMHLSYQQRISSLQVLVKI